MRAVTSLGAAWTIVPLIVVVGVAWFALAKTPRPLVYLVAAYASAALAARGLKEAIARPRPPLRDMAVVARGFSFPSGHATAVSAGVGAIALLAALAAPRRRAALTWAVGGGLLIVLVGF